MRRIEEQKEQGIARKEEADIKDNINRKCTLVCSKSNKHQEEENKKYIRGRLNLYYLHYNYIIY